MDKIFTKETDKRLSKDINFAYGGDRKIEVSVCKECREIYGCTCHRCMHEIARVLNMVKPPRFINLIKIVKETKFKELRDTV